METRIELKQGWKILQDVHDTGEKIGLYAAREADTSVGSQVSELNLPMWIIMEKYGLTENFLESMKDIPLHFPLM